MGILGEILQAPQGTRRRRRSRAHPHPPELRRITRGYKRRRNDTTTFTVTNKIPSFEFSSGGEGRGTKLDEIAWLIAGLKARVTQQSDIIESLRTELKEIKSQNYQTQAELRALKEPVERTTAEIKDVKTQMTGLMF
jgi:septal ring factor EnvC (AmiA/AmiB activator)